MQECVVAIHQPNFFPWEGYFNKIVRADRFVLLDDVQFPRSNKGVWSNRVKILHAGEARWMTAPVDRTFEGFRLINEMRFAATPWRADLLRLLDAAYRKAPHFREAIALLAPLIGYEEDNVAAYNLHALRALCSAFELTTPLLPSSGFPVDVASTDRLIALTKAVGGNVYLCGGGADGYQQDDAFRAAGVTLRYQGFTPAPYAQGATSQFVAGLSVIDMLMHLGVAATASRIAGAA